MRIGKPTVEIRPDEAVLSAPISFDSPRAAALPRCLEFGVPLAHRELVAERSDAFAAALFLLAMRLGEPIYIEGEVSPRLLRGIREYQRIYHSWCPPFRPVELRADCTAEPPPARDGLACAFSGGVDSLYTLHELLSRPELAERFGRLAYGLFVDGFNDAISGRAEFEAVRVPYARFLASLGVELLTLRTNLRDFALPGLVGHETLLSGPGLQAAAAVYRRPYSRFVISSGQESTKESGSALHPELDHWLAADGLEVVHFGAEVTRMEKVRTLAAWEPARDQLRVCWGRPGRSLNCGACEKCIRTMVALEACGALGRFTAFPRGPVDRLYGRWRLMTAEQVNYAREIMAFAAANGRPDVAQGVRRTLRKSAVPAFLVGALRRLPGGRRVLTSPGLQKVYQHTAAKLW
ncbi:hypothetical protein ACFL26_01160 [Patescibacteria group bacterium]